MYITLHSSPFAANVKYLRNKRNISLEKVLKTLNIEEEDYLNRIEDINNRSMVYFTDGELHELCELFMETPYYMIELDLEEMQITTATIADELPGLFF